MDEKTKRYDSCYDIRCPHCGERQKYEIAEDFSEMVTYWGEDGAIEFECKLCDKKFFINEIVIRDWEVAKRLKDFE